MTFDTIRLSTKRLVSKGRWDIDPIVASRSEVSAYGTASLAAVRLGLVDMGWLIE